MYLSGISIYHSTAGMVIFLRDMDERLFAARFANALRH